LTNPLHLVAVAPGFTIDASLLSQPTELEPCWTNLINTDSAKVPPGWVPLIREMLVAIQRVQKASKIPTLPITRIFEEDGELRVIYNTRNRSIHNLILWYVKQADEICENCGWPGEPTSVFGEGFSVHCPVCTFLFNVRSYR
jgi:hypothetical protein